MYGTNPIEEHRTFTIEYEIANPSHIQPCRDMSLEHFCVHPLPNVLSVVRKWKKHDLSKHARNDRIDVMINCYCDYPNQVRKAASLIEDIVEMFQTSKKSRSSKSV
jgi:hypothetical protein